MEPFVLDAKRVFLGTWDCGPTQVTFFPDKIQWIPAQGHALPGKDEYPFITLPMQTITGFEVDKQGGAFGIWAIWDPPFETQGRWDSFGARDEPNSSIYIQYDSAPFRAGFASRVLRDVPKLKALAKFVGPGGISGQLRHSLQHNDSASSATDATDADVTITGSSTREERDAEGRKRAIDVESEQERKKAKTALESRVAEARSTCDADTNAKYRELIRPALDGYAADEIDEDELKRRKKAAREQADAEHEALSTLDKAYGAYTAATVARVAAEKAEDEAADKLEEAVLAIEDAAAVAGKRAGSSGGVKSE